MGELGNGDVPQLGIKVEVSDHHELGVAVSHLSEAAGWALTVAKVLEPLVSLH